MGFRNTHKHTHVRKLAASDSRSRSCYMLRPCVLKGKCMLLTSAGRNAAVPTRRMKARSQASFRLHTRLCVSTKGGPEPSGQLSWVTGLCCPLPVRETDPRPPQAVRGLQGCQRSSSSEGMREEGRTRLCVAPASRQRGAPLAQGQRG